MMEKEFDFGQVGIRMPFRTPEGFFERMQEEALQRVAAEKRKKKIYRLKVGFAAVLSAAAVLCGAVFFLNAPQTEQDPFQAGNLMVEAECNDPFCLYLQQLSDEDLNSLADFMENDIFMYADQ
jgi:hypothetical protein